MRVSSDGFTFLELIVVLFILSLFSVLVFPKFYSLGETSIAAEAKKTASILRYLNDDAVYTKHVYPLKIGIGEGSLSWTGPDGERSERIASLRGVNLESKGELREGEVTVFFGPSGVQESIEIILRHKDEALRVALNPVSGRVKIYADTE